jgi:hypothetical protein
MTAYRQLLDRACPAEATRSRQRMRTEKFSAPEAMQSATGLVLFEKYHFRGCLRGRVKCVVLQMLWQSLDLLPDVWFRSRLRRHAFGAGARCATCGLLICQLQRPVSNIADHRQFDPSELVLFDGRSKRQITKLGCAVWPPCSLSSMLACREVRPARNSGELNHGEICMSWMEMVGIGSLCLPISFPRYRVEQCHCARGAFRGCLRILNHAVSELRQAE